MFVEFHSFLCQNQSDKFLLTFPNALSKYTYWTYCILYFDYMKDTFLLHRMYLNPTYVIQYNDIHLFNKTYIINVMTVTQINEIL